MSKEIEQKKIRPWCVKCQTTYDRNFYMSVNKNHTSGYLPYCKKCLGEIHEEYYIQYKKDVEISLYLISRVADVPFVSAVMALAEERIRQEVEKDREFPVSNIYQYYFSYLNNRYRTTSSNASFDDSEVSMKALKKAVATSIDLDAKLKEWDSENTEAREIEIRNLRATFGNYDEDDLLWLRNKYKEWDDGFGLQTVSARETVRMLCKLQLTIDKKSSNQEDIKKELDSYKNLLTLAGLDPKAHASFNKNTTIGMAIKDIETTKPADKAGRLKTKYDDLDYFERYHRLYTVATIKKSIGRPDSDTEELDREVEQYAVSRDDLAELGIVYDEE